LLPEVGSKVYFPEDRDIGISYCRLLLHDTMLLEDAYRTGVSETPVCECGQDRETAEHFLLCCSRYQEARDKLKDTVSQVLESAKHGKDLQFSYSLLLAHTDVITQKQIIQIKAALYQFISETHRKL